MDQNGSCASGSWGLAKHVRARRGSRRFGGGEGGGRRSKGSSLSAVGGGNGIVDKTGSGASLMQELGERLVADDLSPHKSFLS